MENVIFYEKLFFFLETLKYIKIKQKTNHTKEGGKMLLYQGTSYKEKSKG